MELREYLKIFRKNIFTFLFWGSLVFISLMVFYFQAEEVFIASFSLDLSRKVVDTKNIEKITNKESSQFQELEINKQKSENYDYYYRLKSDEDFGKKISKWLEDEALKKTIFDQAKEEGFSGETEEMKIFSKSLKSEQLAPGYLRINWKTKDPIQANKVSVAIKKILSQKIASIGEKEENWFLPVFGELIVFEKKITLPIFVALSLVASLFVGAFTSLLYHYWKND